jgi:hypothetical protein
MSKTVLVVLPVGKSSRRERDIKGNVRHDQNPIVERGKLLFMYARTAATFGVAAVWFLRFDAFEVVLHRGLVSRGDSFSSDGVFGVAFVGFVDIVVGRVGLAAFAVAAGGKLLDFATTAPFAFDAVDFIVRLGHPVAPNVFVEAMVAGAPTLLARDATARVRTLRVGAGAESRATTDRTMWVGCHQVFAWSHETSAIAAGALPTAQFEIDRTFARSTAAIGAVFGFAQVVHHVA